MEFLHSDIFLIILLSINIILIILYIINIGRLSKLRKNYSNYMKKLGKGENINELIKEYLTKTDKIIDENKEIVEYCKKLDNRADKSFQKTGMVRYNAFKDTGSNLSFAVAILDANDNGIVFNGIYSRDTSNIYAKTIKEGKSEYMLSNEEKEAISKAINNNNN